MSLLDKNVIVTEFEGVEVSCIDFEEVKKAFKDYNLYVLVYHWRFDNLGKKDSKEISKHIKYLEKEYNCKYYDIGFKVIFGDWDK
jgi:sugar phosphate isomerase/epimerase